MKRVGGVPALLVTLVLALASPLCAQTSDSLVPVYTDTTGLVISSPTVQAQPMAPPVDESQWPDPTVTMFKSMLVPGWGQITNKSYIKAALAIGLEAWFISGAIVNGSRMNQALDDFHADPTDLNHFYDYQYYQGMRSDFLWALGITIFVSMFDAYVDAHLRPYDEDTIPGVEPPKGLKVVIPF